MPSYPYRLRNTQNRPVEIHRNKEVLILNPGEFLILQSADPACELLESSGTLSRHQVEPTMNKKPLTHPKTQKASRGCIGTKNVKSTKSTKAEKNADRAQPKNNASSQKATKVKGRAKSATSQNKSSVHGEKK